MFTDTETHHGGEEFLGAVASCPCAKLPSYPEDLARMSLDYIHNGWDSSHKGPWGSRQFGTRPLVGPQHPQLGTLTVPQGQLRPSGSSCLSKKETKEETKTSMRHKSCSHTEVGAQVNDPLSIYRLDVPPRYQQRGGCKQEPPPRHETPQRGVLSYSPLLIELHSHSRSPGSLWLWG